MGRTALELTREDWQYYHPNREREAVLEGRWADAWDVARAAAQLLREDFAAQRVVVFGLLTHQAWFGPASDIDLAAWDIPPAQYYRLVRLPGLFDNLVYHARCLRRSECSRQRA